MSSWVGGNGTVLVVGGVAFEERDLELAPGSPEDEGLVLALGSIAGEGLEGESGDDGLVGEGGVSIMWIRG